MSPLGILMLDTRFPRIPCDIGNPASFDFPVILRTMTGIGPHDAVAAHPDRCVGMATVALLSIKGPITAASYNRAVRRLKNQKTDMLCKPFYVGTLPFHIPNNWDITADYKAGKVVGKEKCFAIAPVDKEMAQTRVWEKKFNLNTGK